MMRIHYGNPVWMHGFHIAERHLNKSEFRGIFVKADNCKPHPHRNAHRQLEIGEA